MTKYWFKIKKLNPVVQHNQTTVLQCGHQKIMKSLSERPIYTHHIITSRFVLVTPTVACKLIAVHAVKM